MPGWGATLARMPWKKSSDALVAAFDAALPDDASVERRKMFGFPSAFVNGQMFTGLFQEEMFVRLAEAERDKLVTTARWRVFEPMPGRPMREYVVIPEGVLDDAAATKKWVKRALDFAATLPPKKKPEKKAAKKKASARTAPKRAATKRAKR